MAPSAESPSPPGWSLAREAGFCSLADLCSPLGPFTSLPRPLPLLLTSAGSPRVTSEQT